MSTKLSPNPCSPYSLPLFSLMIIPHSICTTLVDYTSKYTQGLTISTTSISPTPPSFAWIMVIASELDSPLLALPLCALSLHHNQTEIKSKICLLHSTAQNPPVTPTHWVKATIFTIGQKALHDLLISPIVPNTSLTSLFYSPSPTPLQPP